MFLLDTSALLEGEREGIILMSVIEELDKLKTAERSIGTKARKVITYIYNNLLENIYDEGDRGYLTTDEILLKVANQFNYTLVTADLSLFLQAKGRDIDAKFIAGDKNEFRLKPTATYLTDEEYCEVVSGEYSVKHPENHFLIYGETAYRIKNGTPVEVRHRSLKSSYAGEVKPRNIEQQCLIDLLQSDVPVVAVHSKFGCGKSYLMLNHILEKLETEELSKLIIVPNNSTAAGSRDVGTLPGDLLEKEFVYLGPVIDLIGKDRVRVFMEEGRLEIAPVAFARGRNWDNAIVLVSEAQNLTDYHIKLLLGRIGENSRIFFDGDVRQEDNKVFTENSGLVLLHRLSQTDQADMFGSIELKTIERSRVARMADTLEQLPEE